MLFSKEPKDVVGWLFEIDKRLQGEGWPALDDETIKALYPYLQHKDVLDKLNGGEATIDGLVAEVQAALQHVGARPPMAGQLISEREGLPLGASRIVGDTERDDVSNPMLHGEAPPPMNLLYNPAHMNPQVPLIPGQPRPVSELF